MWARDRPLIIDDGCNRRIDMFYHDACLTVARTPGVHHHNDVGMFPLGAVLHDELRQKVK